MQKLATIFDTNIRCSGFERKRHLKVKSASGSQIIGQCPFQIWYRRVFLSLIAKRYKMVSEKSAADRRILTKFSVCGCIMGLRRPRNG